MFFTWKGQLIQTETRHTQRCKTAPPDNCMA